MSGDSLKKHLIQTVFFQLLKIEEGLWWSGGGGELYLGNHPARSFIHGRIKSQDYSKILLDQIHRMVAELLPEGNTIFQDDNAPIHIAKIVSEWYELELQTVFAEECTKIPLKTIQTLYELIPRRDQAVITAKSGSTQY